MSSHTTGDEAAGVDRLIEQLGGVDALGGQVGDLTTEVRGLRGDLTSRPTRRELDYRRRRMAWVAALYTVLVIFLHDQHVEHCGPGTRSVLGLVSPVCDVSFPLHGHGTAFPSLQTLLGVLLYLALFGAAWLWVKRPLRRSK